MEEDLVAQFRQVQCVGQICVTGNKVSIPNDMKPTLNTLTHKNDTNMMTIKFLLKPYKRVILKQILDLQMHKTTK